MARIGNGYAVRNNIIYVVGTVEKRCYRLSTGRKATKENLAWIRRNAPDVLLQLVNKPQADTVEAFGRLSLEANKHSRKASTQKGYAQLFEQHILPVFGRVALTAVRPMELNAWQSRLIKQGLAPATVRHARAVFRGILADAYMNELIVLNPFDRVKAPKLMPHDVRPFTRDQVEQLIQEADGWFSRFLQVAFFTGLRTGELMGLRWEDVNWQERYVCVRRGMRDGILSEPKTAGSIREVELSPSVITALRMQWQETGLKQSGFVFLTEADTPHRASNNIIVRQWKPLLKRVGLDYRELYQTRHTFASLMIAGGTDVVTVAKLMGHKTVHMTLERYARFMAGQKDIIAGVLERNSAHCVKLRNG
ncbi:site-specific integrase [Campylobacterota bacterium]|nr:site-specific integrase [Campylobacterota bacterium]